TAVTPGLTTTYTIVVGNSGPNAVTSAVVADVFSGLLSGVTFTSTATGGATGNTASGTGNINDRVNLPVGSTITYTATGRVVLTAAGTLSNTATVTPPAGVNDPNPANNTSTVSEPIL